MESENVLGEGGYEGRGQREEQEEEEEGQSMVIGRE
jgi:hypothetical protein